MTPASTYLVSALNPTYWFNREPVPQSPFVAFFHSWPRYGRSNDISFEGSYVLTCFLVALPWVVVAFVCALFATIVNICYGGKRRRGIKADEVSSSSSSSSDDSAISVPSFVFLGCGVLLFNSAVMLLGLALVSNYVFYGGARTVMVLARSTGIGLTTDAALVLTIAERILTRIPTELRSTLASTINVNEVIPMLRKAIVQFKKTARNIDTLAYYLRQFGSIAFSLSVSVYVLLFLGFILLFSTAFPKRRHQRLAMALYVVPFVLGWISVAIITASSTVAADLCVAIGDFQRIVLVQAGLQQSYVANGIDPTKNLFIKYNIQCPANIIGKNVQIGNVVSSFGAVLRSELAVRLLQYLYPSESTARLTNLKSWLGDTIGKTMSCELVSEIAAKFNYAFCHHRGPMLAMFVAWVSLIILAVLLTISYILTQFTLFEASRFLTPFLKLDGSLYEAFSGVVGAERVSKDLTPKNSKSSGSQLRKPKDVVIPIQSTEAMFLMPGEKPPQQPHQSPPKSPAVLSVPLQEEGFAVAAAATAVVAAAPAEKKKRKAKKKLFGRKNAESSDSAPAPLLSSPPRAVPVPPLPPPVVPQAARTSSRSAPPPPPPPPPLKRPAGKGGPPAPPPPPPVIKRGSRGGAPPPPPPVVGRSPNRGGGPPAPPSVIPAKRSSAPPPPPPVNPAKRSGAPPPPPPPPMPALKRPAPGSSSVPRAPPPPPPPPRY